MPIAKNPNSQKVIRWGRDGREGEMVPWGWIEGIGEEAGRSHKDKLNRGGGAERGRRRWKQW